MSDTSRSRRAALSLWSTLVGVIIIGVIIRLPRLNWQPLWWDEGYSVYFATESLGSLIALTALDIHPPLYYAALHSWITLFGTPTPVLLRTFSVLAGATALPLFWWIANGFFQQNSLHHSEQKGFTSGAGALVIGLGLLLFAFSPLHIYYSQEVRMYGLALTFSIWSTGSFWRLLHPPSHRTTPSAAIILAYVLTTALALYTLYYSALIPIAHLIYISWQVGIRKRHPFGVFAKVVAAQIGVGLLYLPWLFYAAPKLIDYVSNKIGADNDIPLTLPAYLGRHVIAFFLGHIQIPLAVLEQVSQLVGWACLLLLGCGAIWLLYQRSSTPQAEDSSSQHPEAISALGVFLLVPLALGFLVNLVYPFFPEGGERLLLIVLPYFLLLLAAGIAQFRARWLRLLGLLLFLGIALVGVRSYYTTPRHVDRDYRSLIQHVMQNSQSSDRVLALFPWQVGYWRAYAPEAAEIGPSTILLGSETLEWNSAIRQQIDAAIIDAGVFDAGSDAPSSLWFPAPLGLGSSLPTDIEGYLAGPELAQTVAEQVAGKIDNAKVINFDATWANSTTFLTAWRVVQKPAVTQVDHQFESVTLAAAGIEPTNLHSSNDLITVRLLWQGTTHNQGAPGQEGRYLVTLRLQDAQGQIWAQRDYALGGVAGTSTGSAAESEEAGQAAELESVTGLIVPAGLPPGPYIVAVGISEQSDSGLLFNDGSREEATDLEETAQPPRPLKIHHKNQADPAATDPHFITIGAVKISAPEVPLSPARLPIEHPIAEPITVNGLTILGSSGASTSASTSSSTLAGTEIPLRVYLQNRGFGGERSEFYVSLLDGDGGGVAGRADWPLPTYPLSAWEQGALVQLPLPVQIPATVPTGEYRLIAGLVNPSNGDKSEAVELGLVNVVQRQAEFTPPQMTYPLLGGAARFGSHADLLGFDLLGRSEDGGSGDARAIEIRLYWHVQQSLLPPHHIFVHLVEDAVDSAPLAQHDDAPMALTTRTEDAGIVETSAPTGSWQAGEYLITQHMLNLPDDVRFDQTEGSLIHGEELLHLRVGLYVPQTGIRLPVSRGGAPIGDNIPLVSEE